MAEEGPWPPQLPLGDKDPISEGQSSLSEGGSYKWPEARPIWKAQIHLHSHKPRKRGKFISITGTQLSNSAPGDNNKNNYEYHS